MSTRVKFIDHNVQNSCNFFIVAAQSQEDAEIAVSNKVRRKGLNIKPYQYSQGEKEEVLTPAQIKKGLEVFKVKYDY